MKSLWQTLAGFRAHAPEHVERRGESRLPAHGLAHIRWEVAGRGEREDAINLVGVSSRGFSFRTSQDLALGQKILVHAEEQEFRAVVRHTEPDGHEFIIGVEVLSGNGDPPEPSDSTDPAVADYERDSSAAATLAAPIGSEHQNS
jgi:hypothetical protein